MLRYLVLGAIMTILGSAGLHAQGATGIPLSPDEIVSIRKAMMDLQQGVAAAMKAGVDEKAEVKPFGPGAKGLVSSSKVIASMFPPGTEKAGDTKALPAVWSNKADFATKANTLAGAAEKLVTLAEANDKAGFATQFAAVGQACGGCHREYRAKE